MKRQPGMTMTIYPGEYGTYEVGDKVTLKGATFEVTELISETTVRIKPTITRWENIKFWFRVKLTFSTWLMVRVMAPLLPKDHKWKGRKFTQLDWYTGATPYCKFLSFALWYSTFLVVVILIKLWVMS